MLMLSHVAYEAINPKKEIPSQIAEADTICQFCGSPIKKGDPVEYQKRDSSFTDWKDLAVTNGDGATCAACYSTLGKSFMKKCKQMLITRNGIYKAMSNNAIARIMLHPPEAPLGIIGSKANMEHMAWRTPAGLDNRLIPIYHNKSVYLIRREIVVRLYEKICSLECPPKLKHYQHHFFSSLDGTLREESEKRYPELASALRSLNPAELYALHCLLRAEAPETPLEPIVFEKL